jgi:hypothetical protein
MDVRAGIRGSQCISVNRETARFSAAGAPRWSAAVSYNILRKDRNLQCVA